MQDGSGKEERSPRIEDRAAKLLGKMPDPARMHGAWVYLIASILAGVLSSVGEGALPALLTGLGFAGIFVAASAFALKDPKKKFLRGFSGYLLAGLAPILALQAGADPRFFLYGFLAIPPAALSGYFAERGGFRSPGALGFAVTAVVVAAPSAACAGGADTHWNWLLFVLLVPFFFWRTVKLRRGLEARKDWNRSRLRRAGYKEAALAVAWVFLSTGVLHGLRLL